jgi:hypothetical protein
VASHDVCKSHRVLIGHLAQSPETIPRRLGGSEVAEAERQ